MSVEPFTKTTSFLRRQIEERRKGKGKRITAKGQWITDERAKRIAEIQVSGYRFQEPRFLFSP